MKTTRLTVIFTAIALAAAFQSRAGVQVSTAQVKEKSVALRVGGKNFITTNPGNSLDLTGVKVGSKQSFTLIDLNGGELADGDTVKIRYTPNSGGKPDPSKASYWLETKEGIKRGKDGDTFKIKKVEDKYALQTSNGKFVGSPANNGVLLLADKQEGALLVEILDLPLAAAAKKAPDQPAPAAEPATAPAPEKPAAE